MKRQFAEACERMIGGWLIRAARPSPLPSPRVRGEGVIAFALVMVMAVMADASLKNATWRVRDVATKSEWAADGLQLKLDVKGDDAQSACTVIDTSGNDRAVTLALCLPLDAVGGTWCDDPQRSRPIESGIYTNLSDRAGGVENSASLYPLAVVVKGETATCLAAGPDEPRMVRFVYDAKRKELRAEFDFGLTAGVEKFPSRADAKLISFSVPAKWAFRRALQHYYELYPDAFRRRVKSAGIWLPFGELGAIKDARDFGFAFHEMAETQVIPRILSDDDRVGCGSYPYVEPPTYWQQYTGKDKGSYDQRRAQLEADAKAGSGIARGTIVSGVLRSTGKRDLYLDDVAYTTQQPWGSNANPDITDPDKSRNWPGKGTYEFERLAALLGLRGKPNLGVDGVYVDSMEGWTELLDFDRDHWRVSQYPLTFDPATKKVCLLNLWGTVAWVKKMSDALHEKNMVLMGNDAFFRRWQLAAYVDVPGREYTWIEKGKLAPVDDEHYLFFRSMSAKRPYLMLMNNRYGDGSMMEPYFQRSVFYAVWPSMFSGQQSASDVSYFDNPEWYNRDRPLFKKYLPMVRKLDSAGWEPVTDADVEPADMRIERYGSAAAKNLAFTIHNPSSEAQDITITLPRHDLGIDGEVAAREWFGGAPVSATTEQDRVRLHIRLPAQGYNVIGVDQPK